MPDWSYRTVFQPILFRLPFGLARDFCLSSLGRLGAMPGGGWVIDLLGHMRAADRLGKHIGRVRCASPVGLGAGLDLNGIGLPALARFGVGFLEVGPATLLPIPERGNMLLPGEASLQIAEPFANPGVTALERQLARFPRLGVPVWARVAFAPGKTLDDARSEVREVIARLAPYVQGFSIDLRCLSTANWSDDDRRQYVRTAVHACRDALPAGVVLFCLAPCAGDETCRKVAAAALELGIDGMVVAGGAVLPDGSRMCGRPTRTVSLETVRRLRIHLGPRLTIIGSGGLCEPQDALNLLDAGANLVQVCSGLALSGPGLPKRINEAIDVRNHTPLRDSRAAARQAGDESVPAADRTARGRPAEETWFWTLLLGAAMAVGGLLAFVIAATRVVLPYDEAFCGVTREQLAAANYRILHFMTHDRITLAGTMFTTGVMYVALSWFAVRQGVHWAKVAIMASAFTGFFSFFLFLGFGYLDTLHAFVTSVLLQLLLLGLHARLPPAGPPAVANLRDDWKWRRSLWGQLLFVIQGCGLIGAGLTIATIGCTQIFVQEDLEFLGSTPTAIGALSPNLLPLIAHDRASFGGMLVSCGICVLLTTLWGFRQGAGWLWWTLLIAGLSGYVPALATHFAVGYTDAWHLAPAYIASALLLAGLVLSYPYLTDPES